MERRDFIKKSAIVSGAVAATLTPSFGSEQTKKKELYELRVYEMRWGRGQLDNYFSAALIPALNRLGIKKVGAFTELGKSEPVKVYLLIPYGSFEEYGKVVLALKNDPKFLQASTAYNEIPMEQQVYTRFESSLLLAFDGLPQMMVPASGPRIFELRTYEGYSEDAVTRKVRMFNMGEVDIFNEVKLNPVFFGEMLAGKNLPCLTYMISFKNMEERDKNWEAFLKHPDWERMTKDPAYGNTVSKIYKTFLEPLPYSQI